MSLNTSFRNQYYLVSSSMTIEEIQSILSKFADGTKTSGVGGTIEGRNVIQKVLERLQEWSQVKILTLNKAKYKVLCLEWGTVSVQTEGWMDSEYSYREVLESTDGIPNMVTRRQCVCSPVNSSHSGIHLKKRGQQIEGSDSPPLLCTCETPPQYWVQLWGPHFKILTSQSRSRETSQR